MRINKGMSWQKVINGEKKFYFSMLLIETFVYTYSFLFSGLAKKDIFSLLEGKQTLLGIDSLKILIILNVSVPLMINCVKQVNSGLIAMVETRLKRNIKTCLLEDILKRKMGTGQIKCNGELLSLFRNESEDCVSYLLEYYYQVPKIVLSIAILIMLFWVNPVFAGISLVPAAGIIILTKTLENHIISNRRMARETTGKVTEFVENIFGNIELFKMMADTDQLGKVFQKKCRARADCEIRERIFDKCISVISENSAGFVMGVILLISIPLYRKGLFSVGEFVMFEYYYFFLESLPNAVGTLIRRHKQAKVSSERMVLEKEENYTGRVFCKENEVFAEVEFRDRSYIIKGRRGEITLLKGGTENERSMLLQRLFQMCSDGLSKLKCAYVPQQPVLFHDSIKENICFGEQWCEEKMKKILDQTDLTEDLKLFSEGIYKNTGKQGNAMSGGQRKRIEIARALYFDAEILFIDGLAEAMDKKTEKILISNIMKLTDKFIVVASESEALTKRATRVIEI